VSGSVPFTADHLQALKERVISLFVWGRVDYVDAFKEPRHVNFRGIMNGDIETIISDGQRTQGWGFKPTADGNDSN
jgi:hypothetical protein